MKQRIVPAVSAALLLATTVFLFGPVDVYAVNAEEFVVSLPFMLNAVGRFALGVFAVVCLLGILLPSAFGRSVTVLVATFGLCLYLQGNFLVGDYGVFDGKESLPDASSVRQLLEAVLWIGLPLLALLFRSRAISMVAPVTLFLVVVQGAGLAALSWGNPALWRSTYLAIEDGRLFQFSRERNVLFVILDTFQFSALDEIVRRDETWNSKLDGYSYYRDATAVFPTTYLSLPAMLTGEVYDNSEPIGEFLDRTMPGRSLPDVLAKNGYRSSVLTHQRYCARMESAACWNHEFNFNQNRLPTAREQAVQLMDVVLFRSVPHVLKVRSFDGATLVLERAWLRQSVDSPQGSDGAPDVAATSAGDLVVPGIARHLLRSLKLERAFREHAAVDDGGPTAQILHSLTPHAPLQLDADCRPWSRAEFRRKPEIERYIQQCICALRFVETVNSVLTELGIYDQTMIVVAADHGSHLQMSEGWPSGSGMLDVFDAALPLVLIKPFSARGELAVSTTPVSLADIPATIGEALGVNHSFPGAAMLDPKAPRTDRTYYSYRWKHAYWESSYLPEIDVYRVSGVADDKSAWTKLRTIASPIR